MMYNQLKDTGLSKEEKANYKKFLNEYEEYRIFIIQEIIKYHRNKIT